MIRRLRLGTYALGTALFGLLCVVAYQSQALPGDTAVSLWLQGISSPFFDRLMKGVSYLGDEVVAAITVAVIIVVLLMLHRRLEATLTFALVIGSAGLSYLFKQAVDRPRPDGGTLEGSLSFPSGHATYAVVLGGVLFYLAPRLLSSRLAVGALRTVAVLFVVLTGASRIYLGEHFPSDVAGSLLLGGMLLATGIVVYSRARDGRSKIEVEHARTS